MSIPDAEILTWKLLLVSHSHVVELITFFDLSMIMLLYNELVIIWLSTI